MVGHLPALLEVVGSNLALSQTENLISRLALGRSGTINALWCHWLRMPAIGGSGEVKALSECRYIKVLTWLEKI